MFATFLYATASILGRNITRLVPESSSSLVLAGRSTAGDLHARRLHFCSSSISWRYPGLLGRSALWSLVSSCCCCDAGHSHHWFLKPLLKFWMKGKTPGGYACLLHHLTSMDTHRLPMLLKSLPLPLTNATPCSQNQQLVANTAKG